MPDTAPAPEFITAREFDRFETRLNERLAKLETRGERTERKIDALVARDAVDGRVIARKTAVHVSWLTPLVVAIIEGLKVAFGK
jgi:hypothetical protein